MRVDLRRSGGQFASYYDMKDRGRVSEMVECQVEECQNEATQKHCNYDLCDEHYDEAVKSRNWRGFDRDFRGDKW